MTYSIGAHGWQAVIDPDRGGNLLRLTFGGRDVLRPWSEEITDPFLAGAPLLLPANRTAGGRFAFGGKEYALPVNDGFRCANLHGSLHCRTFLLTETGENYVSLNYENRGAVFPFSFRITVTYRAEAAGFFSEYAIENLSDGPMPLTFGLHTTFPEPEVFSVALESCQEKDSRHIPTGRYVPLKEQEQRYCTGSPSEGLVISGFYRAGGNAARIGKVVYEVTGFDHWILYNGGGTGGFLCIEPQLGGVNGLNDHPPVIPGGQTLRLATRLYVP